MGDRIIDITKNDLFMKRLSLHQQVAKEVMEMHPHTLTQYLKDEGLKGIQT